MLRMLPEDFPAADVIIAIDLRLCMIETGRPTFRADDALAYNRSLHGSDRDKAIRINNLDFNQHQLVSELEAAKVFLESL